MSLSRCLNTGSWFLSRARTTRFQHAGSKQFSSWQPERKIEQIVILSAGSSGDINLEVHHPVRSNGRGIVPVLLYFPSGLGGTYESEDAAMLHQLTSHLRESAIVRVNYRFDGVFHFPLAIFDTLKAFHWAVECYSRESSTASIGTCGSLIGGSLANALALTECRLGKPRVVVAATSNPVIDWTFGLEHTAEITTPKSDIRTSRRDKQTSIELSALELELAKARAENFANIESYLDPFASPLFFFRTPSVALPEVNEFELRSRETVERNMEDIDEYPIDDMQSYIPRRKSHRRFPPTGSGLSLPPIHISVDPTNRYLHHQAREFVDLIRRSLVSSARREKEIEEKASSSYDSAGDLAGSSSEATTRENESFLEAARNEAHKRVGFTGEESLGLWGKSMTGSEPNDTIKWLARGLGE